MKSFLLVLIIVAGLVGSQGSHACNQCGDTGIVESRTWAKKGFVYYEGALAYASDLNNREMEADPNYRNSINSGTSSYMSKGPAWAAIKLPDGTWGVGRLASKKVYCSCVAGTTLIRKHEQEQVQARLAEIKNLGEALNGHAAESRKAAAELAKIMPELARTVLPEIIAAAGSDKDQYLRKEAIGALRYLGRHSDHEVIVVLSERLKDEYEPARHEAVLALAEILDKRNPPMELLVALKDKSPKVRFEAVIALQRMNVDKATLGALMESLKDDDEKVRMVAAIAIGRFGADARDAVPTLTDLLKDRSLDVREAAAKVLNRIDPTLKAEASKEPNFVFRLKDGQIVQAVSMQDVGDFFYVTTVDGKRTGIAKDEIEKVEKPQK